MLPRISSRTARRASCTTSSMLRCRSETWPRSRWATASSSTRSVSRRRAVTGVRSRWPRSATCSRSAATSSWIRSASAFSARPSSAVSGGPPGTARALESPSRSRCATSATSVTGTLVRRPRRKATSTESATRPSPSATIVAQAPHTPARSSVVGTEASTTSRPRAVTTGTTASRPWSCPTVKAACSVRARSTAAAESAGRGSCAAQHLPAGLHHDHLGPAGTEVGDGARQGLGVVEGGDQGRDALGLLAGPGRGAVLGEVRHEEAQRHDEGHDDRRRRGGHQPGDAAGHQPGASEGGARRTPTPRTLCRYAGWAAVSPSLRRSHDRCTSTVRSPPP